MTANSREPAVPRMARGRSSAVGLLLLLAAACGGSETAAPSSPRCRGDTGFKYFRYLKYISYLRTLVVMERTFATFTDARARLRDLLDAARSGRVTTLTRDRDRFAVVDGSILRAELARARPANAVVAAEGGGWSAFVPGVPAHGEGNDLDAALDDLIEALREYALDWNDRLLTAPNHRDNWALVTLIELSDDDQLREWIVPPLAAPLR